MIQPKDMPDEEMKKVIKLGNEIFILLREHYNEQPLARMLNSLVWVSECLIVRSLDGSYPR